MNDATVKFGYDGSALNAGLSDAEKKLQRFSGSMQSTMERSSRRSSAYMGNVAMQVQDIAVQLQSGTRFSTVLAQQGSQILSAFGAGGAVAGGVLAIGGAFWMMGDQATKAFTEAKNASADFNKDLNTTLIDGSMSKLNHSLDQVHKNIRAASDEIKNNLSGTFAFGANIADVFGGPSVEERLKQQQDIITASGEAAVKIANRMLQTSAQDLELAKLRAQGEDKVADARERQMNLAREIANIDEMKLPKNVREQLKSDATARVKAEDQRVAMEEAAVEKRKADAEAKRAAAERERERERSARQSDELAKKRESIKLSQMDVEILEAQAKGQTRKVKKMEEFAFVQKRAHDFSAQGMDANAAIELAQREWNARENIDKRKKTGRSHIGGVGAKRMMSGGLDEFQRLQNTSTYSMQNSLMPGPYADDPRKVNVPQFSDSLSGRRNSTMKSRMMGGDSLGAQFGAGSLTNRRPGTTANPQISAAVAKGNDAATKLDTTNELLKRGLLGG